MEFGLVEAGGTKIVLGISDRDRNIRARLRLPTTTPAENLGDAVCWFKEQRLEPAGIGIASFGPLQLDRGTPGWGRVLETVKPYWSGADLAAPFTAAYGCPVAVETDVDGAAIAEARWGAGVGAGSLLYLTVGTGIGGGFVNEGRLLRGLSHPEMGHIRIPRHPADMDFAGICRVHDDCFEGLASGPSIKARWGASLSELGSNHPGHEIIAWYLGQAVSSYRAVLQPARIVLGGGVMATPGLIDAVRRCTAKADAGYFTGDVAQVIVGPALGDNSGLLGALAAAIDLVDQAHSPTPGSSSNIT